MKETKFERLAKIDCSDHVEKKGQFSYLSWTWAWDTLKRECPDATFEKHLFDHGPYMLGPDGFAYVMVSVTAERETQTEVYPVLNHTNKAIQNPNAFEVNTALQRCLVKAIAMHGLGLYIYAGEDLPPDENGDTVRVVNLDPKVIKRFQELVDAEDALTLYCFVQACGAEKYTSLFNSFPKGEKTKSKEKVRQLETKGAKIFRKYVNEYTEGHEDSLWVDETKAAVGDKIYEAIAEAAQETKAA